MNSKYLKCIFIFLATVVLYSTCVYARDLNSSFVNTCVRNYIQQQMPGSRIIQQQSVVSNVKYKDESAWLTKAIWKRGGEEYFGEFIVKAFGKRVTDLKVIDCEIKRH